MGVFPAIFEEFSKKTPKVFPKYKGDKRRFHNNIAYHENSRYTIRVGVTKAELLNVLKLFQTPA